MPGSKIIISSKSKIPPKPKSGSKTSKKTISKSGSKTYQRKIISFERSFASHPRSANWSPENKISPSDVYRSSSAKYFFLCDVCDHTFETSLASISNAGQFCPYCANRKLCKKKSCEKCFQNSFSSHPRSNQWSPENKISAREVTKSNYKKYKFICDVCDHNFEARLSHVTNGSFCPYCANQKLCKKNSCEKCFEKSFAAHPKSNQWMSPENKCSAREVFISSNKKYKFICDICSHIYEAALNSLGNCSFCSNKKLCDNLKCEICEKKSFSSNKYSEFWSEENLLTPREVFKCSNEKFKFDCPNCEDVYESTLIHISNNSWCSCTKNKTERKLYDFLKMNCESKITRQKTFDWCRNKNEKYFWPFDFCIEDFNLILELDGPQHFIQVSNWQTPEFTQDRDNKKMIKANKNNYSVIRILQEDVLNDRNDWEKKLIKKIKKYDSPRNIFIGDIYKEHDFNV